MRSGSGSRSARVGLAIGGGWGGWGMEEEERGRGGEGKEGCALLWLLRLWGLVLLCSAGCCCGYGEGCFSLLVSVPVVGFIEERERGSGGMRMRECA